MVIGDGGPTTQIPDPVVDFRAIVGSDPFFQRWSVYSPTQGMNTLRKISFFARYPHGSEAIYRADPIPSTMPFAAFTAEVEIVLGPRAGDDTFKERPPSPLVREAPGFTR